MGGSVEVVTAMHVRAVYHVLAYFDLGRDATNCLHPTYTRAMDQLRPRSSDSPAWSFGRFHARYRKAGGAGVLGILPPAFRDEARFLEVARSLATTGGAPEFVPPLLRRAIAPLADPAGSKLVQLLLDVVDAEKTAFLDNHFRSTAPPGAGMQSFLTERVSPLVDVLYGDIPQTIVVFVAEALPNTSFAVSPARGVHHIALPPPLHQALFHVLFALVKQRSDRVIRHHIPAELKADRTNPIAAQMRLDAAMTTTFHLLLRKRPAEIPLFREWAFDQFRTGTRSPDAAVEALHPMILLPEDAVPAIRTLLGDELEP